MTGTLINIIFNIDFLPLLVIVTIAWLTPLGLSLLKIHRVPAVVVEIIIGFVAGRFFLHLVNAETMLVLDYLALTGLIFIMFLSGLEIDVDQLTGSIPRKRIRIAHFLVNPLLAGLLHFMITLIISYLGSWALSLIVPIPNIWFFSLILTTTFLGLVLPVLKNRGETNSAFGQMLIVAAAVADVIGILLLVFTSVFIRYGLSSEFLIVLSLFLLFYILYRAGKSVFSRVFSKISFQLSHAASQISIRGTMALLFLFVAISQFLGQEGIILGAFLSGLLLSFFMQKDRSLLMLKLDGIGYGFFIPVFFIMVGARFEPSSLKEFDQSLILFLVLMVMLMYLVKVLPSFLWIRIFSFRKVLAGGFLMAARLGLVIAAALVGVELGAISEGMNAVFIIMAVITCILSPLLYNLIYRQEKFQDDKTVIVGGSSVGVLVARRLQMQGRSSVIIERDERRYNELIGKGLKAINKDGSDPAAYQDINLRPENYVVVHTSSDDINLGICDLLRTELHHERIISIPGNSVVDHSMRNLGVEILDARRVLATTIENLIVRPITYQSLVETFEHFSVLDVTITNNAIEGKQVKEIPLHKDAMLMLLTRGHVKHIPHGDTYLRTGDVITVFGTETALEQIRNQFSGR